MNELKVLYSECSPHNLEHIMSNIFQAGAPDNMNIYEQFWDKITNGVLNGKSTY